MEEDVQYWVQQSPLPSDEVQMFLYLQYLPNPKLALCIWQDVFLTRNMQRFLYSARKCMRKSSLQMFAYAWTPPELQHIRQLSRNRCLTFLEESGLWPAYVHQIASGTDELSQYAYYEIVAYLSRQAEPATISLYTDGIFASKDPFPTLDDESTIASTLAEHYHLSPLRYAVKPSDANDAESTCTNASSRAKKKRSKKKRGKAQ